jgi:hypothetical protein
MALPGNPRKLLTQCLRLMTQHSRRTSPTLRRYDGRCLTAQCGSSRAASERMALLPLTPNAVIRRFTNSVLPDAAGGFVSVLIGLCDFTFFLCCLPSIGLVERCGEGDICD